MFPDWLQITTPTPVTLPGVSVTTEPNGGAENFTVSTLNDGGWVVQATVTGDTDVNRYVAFPSPVSTSAVRITVTKDWEQDPRYLWTRIGEVSPGRFQNDTSAPLLRTTFDVTKPVRSARLYLSGLGYYVASIDGQRVGGRQLAPAFTMYNKRVLYDTHDVTRQLHQGKNAIGVELGRGMYGLTTPTIYWGWNQAVWHADPKLLAKLQVTYADGSHSTVVSNTGWRTADGPHLADSVYAGESYDARKAQPGWNTPGFDDHAWAAAQAVAAPAGQLHADDVAPITIAKTFPAQKITQPTPGVYVFDFGRTTSGWARLNVSGPAGTTVTLGYGEELNSDGTVNTAGLQTDHYTLRGGGSESWQPSFSWNGYRYVQVTGLPAPPASDTLIGESLHTSVSTVGAFSSSDPLYNSIHAAVQNTVLNNLYGYPTDTPMYEKNGWTGDAALMMPFGVLNFDLAGFIRNWANDIQDAQRPNGAIPLIIPADGHEPPTVDAPRGPSPEWAAAYPTAIWTLWQAYGDKKAVADHYPGLKRYVDYEIGALDSEGLANTWLGDWSAPGPMPDTRLTATAYVYRAVTTIANLAQVLGNTTDAAHYDQVAAQIKTDFNKAFFHADKGYYQGSESSYLQTSNALPLAFGLAPAGSEQKIADSLAADVTAHGNHLDTGILGTNVLLPMLTRYGHADIAAQVADQTTYPSWGYWLANGADTLWESWSLDARSHDHYMFGTVDRWFYQDVAGLQQTGPAWSQFTVDPAILPGHTSANASINTVRGLAASSWHTSPGGSLSLDVTVPVGATAEVKVPAPNEGAVVEGHQLASRSYGVRFERMDGGRAVFSVGSGTYHFRVTKAGTT